MDEIKPTGKPVFRPHKITLEDIKEGCVRLYGPDNTETQLCVSQEELRAGVEFVQKYDKSVTIFGSHLLGPETEMYQKAEKLAARIVKETGYAVASGGGPGIMEAVNKGAFEAGGQSLGLTIEIEGEYPSAYLTDRIDFNFFFNRKTILAYGAEAYVYFPGSYGTLDELFTVMLLVATKKIAKTPIILFGSEYWKDIDDFFKKSVTLGITPKEYTDLYIITDDENVIIDTIKNTPIRDRKSNGI